MKNVELNIEKSTLRELNNNEVDQIAGGTAWTAYVSPRLLTHTGGDDDVIFDDGFDEQP